MPQFYAGETRTARITLTNPKVKATDYNAWLYMGINYAPMAEASFSLSAGQSKEVPFSVVMPGVIGTYPVYIGVFSAGVLIPPLYRGIEDVVIKSVVPSAYLIGLMDALNNAHALCADGYDSQFSYIPLPPGTTNGIPAGYPGTRGSYGLQSALYVYGFSREVIIAEAILIGLVQSGSQISFFHDYSKHSFGVVSMRYDSNVLAGPGYYHLNSGYF